MSSSANKQKESVTNSIESWLRENPDVFQHNPEFLELINLPDSRGTSSLLERQIKVLKNRISDYQKQQQAIVNRARQNETISDNFMPVFSLLIGLETIADFAQQLPLTLKQTFAVDYVGIKLASQIKTEQQTAYQEACRRITNQTTVCDNRLPSTITSLFFDQPVGSAALIPLRNEGTADFFGILALGDKDEQRYTPDLGTVHLDRLGLMAGICLSRLQSQSE